jgi:hypothetical protein
MTRLPAKREPSTPSLWDRRSLSKHHTTPRQWGPLLEGLRRPRRDFPAGRERYVESRARLSAVRCLPDGCQVCQLRVLRGQGEHPRGGVLDAPGYHLRRLQGPWNHVRHRPSLRPAAASPPRTHAGELGHLGQPARVRQGRASPRVLRGDTAAACPSEPLNAGARGWCHPMQCVCSMASHTGVCPHRESGRRRVSTLCRADAHRALRLLLPLYCSALVRVTEATRKAYAALPWASSAVARPLRQPPTNRRVASCDSALRRQSPHTSVHRPETRAAVGLTATSCGSKGQ